MCRRRPAFAWRHGYPLGASVIGEGVGATRLGVFSTGTALERVTEWEPGRKLAFAVLQDVPAMRELSPYAHVHAPHNIGYFSTKETSFELIPGRAEALGSSSAHPHSEARTRSLTGCRSPV